MRNNSDYSIFSYKIDFDIASQGDINASMLDGVTLYYRY